MSVTRRQKVIQLHLMDSCQKLLRQKLRTGQELEVMSDKAEESAIGPEDQMKRHGEPMSPPPSKRQPSMALSVEQEVEQEGEGASHPVDSAMSSEDDEPVIKAMSVLGDVPDQLPIPVEISAEMKLQLKEEIRRFGQKYERVFKLLEGMEGSVELQDKFVLLSVKETARFKRQNLIRHLQKVPEKLELDHLLKKDNCTPNL
ncbi:LOW QUALITY PROTEIN: integrator complex subunit 6-like [Enhydra lutris kenyoni]|uniref:LOW QUALITY PROTEIN: integrator complex subunit 6-like n=1 Tax=Enhydra lutris kenyoni TaxID=391180 RepID=A0A2Y9LJZ7_ENHLU|nr:LOW QUALITY PROTEIN: integrator complex subunit 6-like [Enhydra lutris kenyoni]